MLMMRAVLVVYVGKRRHDRRSRFFIAFDWYVSQNTLIHFFFSPLFLIFYMYCVYVTMVTVSAAESSAEVRAAASESKTLWIVPTNQISASAFSRSALLQMRYFCLFSSVSGEHFFKCV
jgi:hypothetical protein